MTKEENEKRLEYLKSIVRRLPDKPGSYQFYDEEKTIIYVGKAKNLKNRVSSYFHTEVDRFIPKKTPYSWRTHSSRNTTLVTTFC